MAIRIDGAPPRYREGWDDIVRLIAERDAQIADPTQGPPAGIGRIRWRQSMAGLDDDLWMQRARVHDIAEAWTKEGLSRVRCSCGLEVNLVFALSLMGDIDDFDNDIGHHNLHANQGIERDRALEIAFYDAPGHRDSFHHSRTRSYVTIRTLEPSDESETAWEFHLWCSTCGDLGLCPDAVTNDLDVDNAAIELAITAHDAICVGGAR